MRSLRGGNASAVIRTLNPKVRGWAAYYRGVVSTETFQSLDEYVWRLTYKWALYRHTAAVRKALTLNAISTTDSSAPDGKEQRLVHEHCRRRRNRPTQSGIANRQ
jgi:hypothetical protein